MQDLLDAARWKEMAITVLPLRLSLMPAVTRPREKSGKCRNRGGRSEEIVKLTDQTKAYSTFNPLLGAGSRRRHLSFGQCFK